MNIHQPGLLLAFVAGITGGYLGGYLNNETHDTGGVSSAETDSYKHSVQPDINIQQAFQKPSVTVNTEYQFESLLLKIEGMQIQIESLQKALDKTLAPSDNKNSARKTVNKVPDRKSLVKAGINPDEAEDILRRINEQDFRRLELHNLIRRSDSAQRRQYSKELRELNKNKITLRSEMGDEYFDRYLYSSGHDNRVKINSVMKNSPADSSGLQKDDVFLSYDNKKILSWPDIGTATTEGEIGSYVSVEILRNGERITLSVPRGTLGIQLDTILLDPEQ